MLKRFANRRVASVVLMALCAVCLFATAAFAQTPVDPTGGAAESMFDDISSFITGILLPAAALVVLIGIAFRLAVKWVRRGVSS